MKKLLNIVKLSLGMLISTSTLAGEAPFNIEVKGGALFITSKADQLVITNIIVDRGNCKHLYADDPLLSKHYRFPKTLNFAGTDSFYFSGRCQFLEVVVETNQGSWTFTKN